MRLADFIRNNLETLLEEWDAVAELIVGPGARIDRQALRDHAGEMLRFVADDLEQPQSEAEQIARSRGLAIDDEEGTSATAHGVERMRLGLSLMQLVTEHRALRTSITRLWAQEQDGLKAEDIDELVRFNEVMDRLLSESVQSFSAEKARQSRLFEAMLASSPNLSCIVDTKGNLRYVNAAMAARLGQPAHALAGRNVAALGLPQATELREEIRAVARQQEPRRGELELTAADGREMTYEYVLSPVLDERGRVEAVAGTAHDITERKAAEQESWRSANIDPLTDIPNRRLFFDRLAQALSDSERRRTPLGLLFIDLDYFKQANDRLGHEGGDEILRRMAQRICACVRRADSVGRLGGDEFIVYLKDVGGPEEVTHVAEKILAELSRPLEIQGETAHLAASIGVALFPQDGGNVRDLVRRADQAMYAAKASGRSRIQFHDRGA